MDFQGMALVSERAASPMFRWWEHGAQAPSAHRRLGYSLAGCVPAEPASASPSGRTIATRARPIKPIGHRSHALKIHAHSPLGCVDISVTHVSEHLLPMSPVYTPLSPGVPGARGARPAIGNLRINSRQSKTGLTPAGAVSATRAPAAPAAPTAAGRTT